MRPAADGEYRFMIGLFSNEKTPQDRSAKNDMVWSIVTVSQYI